MWGGFAGCHQPCREDRAEPHSGISRAVNTRGVDDSALPSVCMITRSTRQKLFCLHPHINLSELKGSVIEGQVGRRTEQVSVAEEDYISFETITREKGEKNSHP